MHHKPNKGANSGGSCQAVHEALEVPVPRDHDFNEASQNHCQSSKPSCCLQTPSATVLGLRVTTCKANTAIGFAGCKTVALEYENRTCVFVAQKTTLAALAARRGTPKTPKGVPLRA